MKAIKISKFGPYHHQPKSICPCASEKLMYNAVNTLAPSFSIGSSSFLQVTRTTIRSRMCSKFDQI